MSVPLSFKEDPTLFFKQGQKGQPRSNQINPQTTEICAKLEINDPMMLIMQQVRKICFEINKVLNFDAAFKGNLNLKHI